MLNWLKQLFGGTTEIEQVPVKEEVKPQPKKTTAKKPATKKTTTKKATTKKRLNQPLLKSVEDLRRL